MTNAPTRQSWIINLPCDMLFLIGIPLFSLGALLMASNYYSSADIAWFVLAFFAVGHHLPGFMRAYGERELFALHKAQFLIAPVRMIRGEDPLIKFKMIASPVEPTMAQINEASLADAPGDGSPAQAQGPRFTKTESDVEMSQRMA